MKLYIKNMVCSRCLKVIKQELEELEIKVTSIELGELVIDDSNSNHDDIIFQIEKVLHSNNFEIIHSSEEILVEKIKHFLINRIEELPLNSSIKLSESLTQGLNHEYKSLSKLFSSLEKITIEKYFIRLKIEKVKELIQLQQHTFSEISYLLNYTNVNHLSRQFKEIVGKSMTEYKKSNDSKRIHYDEII